MSTRALSAPDSARVAWLYVAVALPAWIGAYFNLTAFSDAVFALLPLERGTRLGDAVHFFIFDTQKVILLLTGIVFAMGIVHTFFSPERTRALLSGRREGVVAGGILLVGYVFNAVL